MKHHNYKTIVLSLIIVLSSLTPNLAVSKDETFSVFAKLPLLGKIEVQNIKTNLITEDSNIYYSYHVEPTQILDFFDNKVSSGYIRGEIENYKFKTKEYFFKTEKENFRRIINFKYNNGIIKNVSVEPIYDVSKITDVSSKMIEESVDPVTMFYLLTDYNFIEKCNKTINVYDGKRRYDLILSSPSKNDIEYKCTLTHQKIAGYKASKIKENKKYVSDLKFIMNENNSYEFKEVSFRNDNIDLLISKNNQ